MPPKDMSSNAAFPPNSHIRYSMTNADKYDQNKNSRHGTQEGLKEAKHCERLKARKS